MKINTQETQKNIVVNEGLITNSIYKYIEKSKFPKSLVVKKLKLMIKSLKKTNDKIEESVISNNKIITGIIKDNQKLKDETDKLLRKLMNSM